MATSYSKENNSATSNYPKKRDDILRDFKEYKQQKDGREMDDICKKGASSFELQVQQKFLRDYTTKYPQWKKLLLYHQIGSGKTCTSITMAEEYRKMNPRHTIYVILPARLQTNFIDELMTPCGMNLYATKAEMAALKNSTVTEEQKVLMREKIMKKINAMYQIMSIEKFRNIFKNEVYEAGSVRKWVQEFTKNSLVIVDEVHNVIPTTFDYDQLNDVLEMDSLPEDSKSINSLVFALFVKHAHSSSKMIMMTATPIFNSIKQFKLLTYLLNTKLDYNKMYSTEKLAGFLRGKVSFFPGTSKKAYPNIKYNFHEIPVTEIQKTSISNALDKNNESDGEDIRDAFRIQERQQLVVALRPGQSMDTPEDYLALYEEIDEVAPKFVKMVEIIDQSTGKHIVYSSFIKRGLNLVQYMLEKQGWVDLLSVVDDPILMDKYKFKVYAFWSGATSNSEKDLIKNVINSTENMYGEKCKVLLGSPSIKEGVSFKHVQHMHILDPVWNISAKSQLEGRAVRFCSHSDIKSNDVSLKRTVQMHYYMAKRYDDFITADDFIYNVVIPNKATEVIIAENTLKSVALDHHIFNELYNSSLSSNKKNLVSKS